MVPALAVQSGSQYRKTTLSTHFGANTIKSVDYLATDELLCDLPLLAKRNY